MLQSRNSTYTDYVGIHESGVSSDYSHLYSAQITYSIHLFSVMLNTYFWRWIRPIKVYKEIHCVLSFAKTTAAQSRWPDVLGADVSVAANRTIVKNINADYFTFHTRRAHSCKGSVVAKMVAKAFRTRSESEHKDGSGQTNQNCRQAINLLLYGQLRGETTESAQKYLPSSS